jgi:hypothetical protein
MAENGEPLPDAVAARQTAPSPYSEIGERVANVFSAAEAAADLIRAEAQREAEEVLRLAHVDADTVRESATAYEVEVHAKVDALAMERRQEAEMQARRLLEEAESQAEATREEAEQLASQIEAGARQRQVALEEESRAVTEGLQRTLQELRRLTVHVEALVEASPDAGGETLVDALMPYTTARSDDS